MLVNICKKKKERNLCRKESDTTDRLYRSELKVLWVSLAKDGLINSNQRNVVFISLSGVVCKGHIKHTDAGTQT